MAEDAGRPSKTGKTAGKIQTDNKKLGRRFEHMTSVTAAKARLDRTMPMPQPAAPMPLSLEASPPEFLGGAPAESAATEQAVGGAASPEAPADASLPANAGAASATDDLPDDRAELLVEAQKQLVRMRAILQKLRETPE